MKTLTATPRPRIAPTVAGTSGSKTLEGLTLVQDKSRRAVLAERDRQAYLAAGGRTERKAPPVLEVSEDIRLLFTADSWNTFCDL